MQANNAIPFRESFERLSGYISSLSDHAVFHKDEKIREIIANTVKEVLSLFMFLANKANRIAESKQILEKFRRSFGTSDINDYFSSSSEYSSLNKIQDEINYLRVCVKNVSNIDLDSDIPDDLPVISGPIHNDSFESNKKLDAFSVYKSLLYSDDLPFFDVQEGNSMLQDFHAKIKAHKMLDDDINSGRLYVYKTKPNINIWIKKMLYLLYASGTILSAVFLAIIAFTRGSELDKWTGPIVVTCASLIYLVSNLFHIHKTFRNDNFKYTFQRKIFFYSIVSFLIIAFSTFNHDLRDKLDFGSGDNSLFTVLFIINGLTWLIYFLSYIYLQPEKNEKLIKETLEKYLSNIESK